MLLKTLALQNFRNHKKSSFSFDKTNIIIGPNTIGKTNILEAIYFLSHGTSFRSENDKDTIKENEEFARIQGKIEDEKDITDLTLIIFAGNGSFFKKYLVNNIPKRQIDFVSKMFSVLFTPSDIEIITDSPNLRRKYFDSILFQADKKYRSALLVFEKALKNRNKMLFLVKEGKKIISKDEFEYWDNLLLVNGNLITNSRENLISFLNQSSKSTFDFSVFYDKSTITRERLDKYFEIETKTGVTLVGPQRDDFVFNFADSGKKIKEFGSRGEQRLTILQLKLLEIDYLIKKTGKTPVLLLDDIFSELDNQNIQKVLGLIDICQTIITTTHQEFIPQKLSERVKLIQIT